MWLSKKNRSNGGYILWKNAIYDCMRNFTETPNFIFSALERELLTLSIEEIIEALVADYKSFSHGNDEGIAVPEDLLEKRLSHSCILCGEGCRLALRLPELGKKLVMACLFYSNERAEEWLTIHGEGEAVKTLHQKIADFEAEKERERQKAEE